MVAAAHIYVSIVAVVCALFDINIYFKYNFTPANISNGKNSSTPNKIFLVLPQLASYLINRKKYFIQLC